MKKTALMLVTLLTSASAFAQDATAAAVAQSANTGWYALAAGIAIALAAFGGATGQGKIGAAAMDGIARNPQAQQNMFVSMIIGLVLIESLVIYALVIAFMLVGKI